MARQTRRSNSAVMRSDGRHRTATADVHEPVDGREYVIEIDVPGRTQAEITIEATSDGLTVTAQPEQPESEGGGRYVRRERAGAPRSWVFEFPVDIDPDLVQANLERGVLTIHAPKVGASQPKVIHLGRAS
jgi:HSP20 family protein